MTRAGHNWARGVFQARTSAGLSQSSLEQTIGVCHGYVSHIEAGRRVPSVEVLESIADACGIRLVRLVEIAECSTSARGKRRCTCVDVKGG